MAAQKIVIIGVAGRLGSELKNAYEKEHEVIGLTRAQLDLRDPYAIAEVLGALDYDQLVLPGALTAVDYCEDHREEAFAVNADGPREVARVCREKGARMTYISTDFVFDGEKEGPYTEEDQARPISVYGASKLRGEEYVLETSPDNLVVRVSWLYGSGKAAFPEWIVLKSLEESILSLPGEKMGSPTYSADLASLLHPLLFHEEGRAVSGIYHLCNSGSCSWQEWGQFCLEVAREAELPVKALRIDKTTLGSVEAFIARRPVNSILSTGKYSRLMGVEPRAWQEALREHLLQGTLFRQLQNQDSSVLN